MSIFHGPYIQSSTLHHSIPIMAAYPWNRPVESAASAQDNFVSPELKAGSHVRHAAFGEGVVVSCQSVDGDCEVVVAFQGAGVRKLLLSYAKLEKVEKQ